MRLNKKHVSTALIGSLALSVALTGCSSNKPQANNSNSSGKTQGVEAKAELPPYELTVAFFTVSSQNKGIPAVEEQLNKLTKAKINTTVKLVPISYGSYDQQMNLMMAGNEKLDLFVTEAKNYGTQVGQGRLLPLDDLIDKQAPNIKKAVDPMYLEAARVNGKIYGITSIRDLAANRGLVMRKDLVDKYKIDLTKIKTYNDLDLVFQTIKDNEPGMTPLVGYTPKNPPAASFVYKDFDNLDNNMGVINLKDDNLKVVNLYETKEYAGYLDTVRRWYNAGFMAKDVATTKDNANDLVKANRAFSFFTSMKPGYESQASRSIGKEMVSVEIAPATTLTNNITKFMWSIAKNSKDPSRAMMFLDLLYSDKEIINLLDWGIEGKDYVKAGDNMIDYPSGVNATSVEYGLNLNWLFGNSFISYVFKPDPADLWDRMGKFNKEAAKSKALGFTFDVTPVKTEVATVTNVINQYQIGLETGTLDPQKELPDYIKKLKDAGMDKVIAEKQKQLDEWKKTRK
ncbi:ABC transporter substrate-binding protein [Paenibacillus cremeus]|uniref:ABC transporter substrate-binding protein n=1 Tax=Paenibacillus cremeus TaxID=2163881 RepID=A0A559K895_9BACL|nr:ABC transporter substrate-binding protein [Paenibacillus cremeus]TVY08334.1 ABC transporter substrate-binding protein [Paenibacillus cremeus]